MENKSLTARRVMFGCLLILTALLLYIFLSLPMLTPLVALAFTPLLLLFGSSRRWLASAGSLIIIIMVWFGLMVGVNGIDLVKVNLIQGFEQIKEINKK